jgi:hypothetical protein
MRGPNPRAVCDRDLEMKRRYEGGETLDAIGKTYGITRERVRQILKKYFDFTAASGGQKVTMDFLRIARAEKKDQKYRDKYGFDYATYKEFMKVGRGKMAKQHPARAFVNQKNSADWRGIEWQFKLADWRAFWQESGKWPERGLSKGKYVMCRYGDAGPYSRDNCYIAETGDNIRHYQDRKQGRLHKYSVPNFHRDTAA